MKRNHHPLKRSGLVKIYDILDDSYTKHKETGAGIIELAEREWLMTGLCG
jgi:hypothetical protein